VIEPRRSVREIRAYSPPLENRRGRVRLDFNENTAGTGWEAADLSAEEVAAYPEYGRFMGELSSAWGMSSERLLVTNGTGEAIHLIAFTFIEPGVDTALTSAPTFALIPHNLKLVGARLVEVPATADLGFDAGAIETALKGGVKLAIFASPDNPTGATVSSGDVRTWCEGFPDTLFVIDEAYAEYGEESVLPLTMEYSNLIVLRTFSKAWGMAGLRLGVVAGDPRLIEFLLRVRAPYSVNVAAMRAASFLLSRRSCVEAEASKLLSRRPGLLAQLERRGFATHAGGGNFFLMMAGLDAAPLAAFLRGEGILVRDQSARIGMSGIVRVTVGTEEENRRFLEAVDMYRESRALVFDLDDTLVDTSRSYDATVAELVERHSGKPLADGELAKLRQEGGFNDDWEAAGELIRRRGIEISHEKLAREGREIYLPLAKEHEQLIVNPVLLEKLARRARIFVFTGRTRAEYEPVWSERLGLLFEGVFCRDDFDGLKAKPSPDMLLELMSRTKSRVGAYVGNSVDDMMSARAAGLFAIGVETTCPRGLMLDAGANEVLETVNDLWGAFRL